MATNSSSTFALPSCTRCGYLHSLVKCTNCERAYCQGSPGSTGCLTIGEGSAETFICMDCHQARHPGAPYPHYILSPGLRFIRDTPDCPSDASLHKQRCTGLQLNIFSPPNIAERAKGFAQLFSGSWRSQGWNLGICMYALGRRFVNVTAAYNYESTHYSTERECRSLSVFLLEGEPGVWQELLTPPRFAYLLDMATEETRPANGLTHYSILVTTGSRGIQPQWLLDVHRELTQDYPGTRGGYDLVAMLCMGELGLMQFGGVFVRAAVNGLGHSTMFQRALEQAWALELMAARTDLHIWATGAPPALLRGVELHRKPWEDASLCPSCSCAEPATSAGRPRSWRLNQATPVDSPTAIRLECTWCGRIETRTAPLFPKLSMIAGMYFVRVICGEEPPCNNLPQPPEAGPSGGSSRSSKKRKRPNKHQKVAFADPSSSK